MTFRVEITTDNAASTDDGAHPGHTKVARILRVIADEVASGYRSGTVQDARGNTVGSFGFEVIP